MGNGYVNNLNKDYQILQDAGFDIIVTEENGECNGKIYYKEELKAAFGGYSRMDFAFTAGIKHAKKLHQFVLDGTPEKMDEDNFIMWVHPKYFTLHNN